jgi:hypothetical protein
MSRIRTIKPSFFRHEALYEAEIETKLPLRVSFAGLWTVADREGRFKWRPRELKLDILPYDEVDPARVLDALATRGFIVQYESGGELFGYIPSWHKHQVINNRESASNLPDPNKAATSTHDPRVNDACATRHDLAQGEGEMEEEGNMEEEGKESSVPSSDGTGEASAILFGEEIPPQAPKTPSQKKPAKRHKYSDHFTRFWTAYPTRDGSPDKFDSSKAFDKALKSGVDPEVIIAGAARYAENQQRLGNVGTKHVKIAATWLNKKCWEDFDGTENVGVKSNETFRERAERLAAQFDDDDNKIDEAAKLP